MSDPHAHGGGGSGGGKTLYIKTGAFVIFVLFFVAYFSLYPQDAEFFSIILYVIDFICVIALAFMIYKLNFFRKKFAFWGGEIVKNYEKGLKHHHDDHHGSNVIEQKYNLAIKQVNSKTPNEWKTGLIELDNFIRLGLLDKGYIGQTNKELLKDAKSKGFKYTEAAENIVMLRQLMKTKGLQFDYPKKDLVILLKSFKSFSDQIIKPYNDSPDHKAH